MSSAHPRDPDPTTTVSDASTRSDAEWLTPAFLVEVLRAQWMPIAVFFSAVVITASIATVLADREYRAVALIHLMPRAGQEIDVAEVVDNDAANWMESRERARTQVQIIQSRTVRTEVLRRYAEAGYDDLRLEEGGLAIFGGMLSAGPREDTQLVEIRVTHADPERAALLANLVAEVYRTQNLTARTDAARETKVWIEGKSGLYKDAVETHAGEVLDFKAANDMVDIDEKIDGITSRLQALQAALSAATTERVLLATHLSEHERLLEAGQFEVLAGMFDTPALAALAKEHATVVTRAAEVQARYGDQHPEHRWAVSHVERVETLLADEVRQNVEGERSQVLVLRRQEARLERELEQVKGELLEKQRLAGQYAELKTEHDRALRVYESLGQREAEVELQANTRLNDVRLVDAAIAPARPSKPDVLLNVTVAIGIGLVGGFGLGLVRQRMSATFTSADEISRHLDEQLLGVVPTQPHAIHPDLRALQAHEEPSSLVAESLRGIRAILSTLPGKRGGRRLLVTSCLPDEGKSDTATGLAISFAQLGATVALIDADLRSPRLHQLFGLPVAPGLSNAAAVPDQPERFMVPTQVPNLHVMPAGEGVEYPNELLASSAVERLLTYLGETYQVIIIDTPPAGLVSDSMELAERADGIVFVVRRGVARRDQVAKTLARMRQVGGHLLGLVLNDVPPDKDARRYGYTPRPRRAGDERAAAR